MADVWHEPGPLAVVVPRDPWNLRRTGSVSGSGSVVAAIRLADQYRHRIPTVDELMRQQGMSQATAYRWVERFKQARGVE